MLPFTVLLLSELSLSVLLLSVFPLSALPYSVFPLTVFPLTVPLLSVLNLEQVDDERLTRHGITPVSSALKRQRQEDWEFKIIFSYTVNSKAT